MDPPAPVGAQVVKPMRTQPIRWVITGIGAGLLIASPAWATAANVRSALADFAHRATKGDLVLVLLIGHGTGGDGDEAKFNLVGPDLSASEWADLVRAVPGRVVFVDTSSASFPFLQRLAA